jgi:hypothetical protein
MELKNFCAAMGLAEEAVCQLKPHWEKILNEWNGQLPEFVSEKFLRKYLPFLQLPVEDEEEIIKRARKIIELCEKDEACALYMFVLHYGALILNLQLNPALKSDVWGENEGIAALLAAVSCAPLVEESCRKKGIPEKYALDALQWIGGTVAIYKLAHNNIPGHSLNQLYWLHLHVDGELYRIGRFEYLIHRLPEWVSLIFRNEDGVLAVLAPPKLKLDARGRVVNKDEYIESFIEEDGPFITGIPCSADGFARVNETLTIDRREFKPLCSAWDIVPSIHIPGGLRMGWEEVLDSMKEAKDFFRRYLKTEIRMIVCGSWILNPALEKFAPKGNMARFRKEVFALPMMRWGSEGRDGMFFAFGRGDVDPTELEAVNSVQRLLQEIFRAEGTLRTGGMFVLTEDLDKLGEMYYRTKQKVL